MECLSSVEGRVSEPDRLRDVILKVSVANRPLRLVSKATSRECKSGYLALFLGYGTSVSVTLLSLVESGGKYKFVAGKGKKINPTSLSNNK